MKEIINQTKQCLHCDATINREKRAKANCYMRKDDVWWNSIRFCSKNCQTKYNQLKHYKKRGMTEKVKWK